MVDESQQTVQEDAGAARRYFAVVGALLGMGLVAVVLGIMVFTSPTAPPIPANPERSPPAELLAEVRAEAEKLRTSYGWVDKEAGVVRIPLDVAIEKLIAERAGEQG